MFTNGLLFYSYFNIRLPAGKAGSNVRLFDLADACEFLSRRYPRFFLFPVPLHSDANHTAKEIFAEGLAMP
jgi:hypothetical protein